MRKYFYLTLLFLLFADHIDAQNISINSDGSAPDASSMLDIKSSNSGILIPRVSLTGTDDNATIPSAATSLLIYNTATVGSGATAVTPGFYYFDGSEWVKVLNKGDKDDDWEVSGDDMYNANSGNVGVGTNDPQSILDVQSTTSGFIPPRMTTAQKEAIANPVEGMLLYDTDLGCFSLYDGGEWGCLGSNIANTNTNYATYEFESGGDCIDYTVNGTYFTESGFGSQHYLEIYLNFTTTGFWYISTDAVNGFQFTGSGVVTETGVQAVKLYASGNASVAQINNFTLVDVTNQTYCYFAVETYTVPGNRQITQCMNFQGTAIEGNEYNGNYSLYARLQLYGIGGAGGYNIISDTVNGLYFKGIGQCSGSSYCYPNIFAYGSPIEDGTFTYTFSGIWGASSSCSMDLTVENRAVVHCTGTVGGPYSPTLVYQGDTYNGSSPSLRVYFNVVEAGAIDITSDTVNGVYFYRSYTSSPSSLPVYPTGTAIESGNFTFNFSIVNSEGSTCYASKTLNFKPYSDLTFTNCGGATVNGDFYAGIELDGQTVQLQVTPSVVGNWIVQSDTINGCSFFGSGTFANTNSQTITLKASGTPVVSGTSSVNVYPANNSSEQCAVVFNIQDSVKVYTLGSGSCSNTILSGNYLTGNTLSASNYVTIDVNFLKAGNYTIYTDTVNGIYFYGSGNMLSTGIKSVKLYGYGTPTNNSTNTYAIQGLESNSGSCAFDLTPINPAEFTINCEGSTVNGNYFVSTTLEASNTITLAINATATGPFKITAGPLNGYKFNAQGNISTTGIQTITLYGSGTPGLVQTNTFTIDDVYGSASGCDIDVQVFGAAGYTLNCGSISVNGTFKEHKSFTGSNYIQIQANVVSIGSYSISTNVVNGYSFQASGNFTSTGSKTITLYPTGNYPIAEQTDNFTLTANNGNTCPFSVNVGPPQLAIYNLGGGSCNINGSGYGVFGVYREGIALNSAHYVKVKVYVTTVGYYEIATPIVNGYSFSDGGFFETTGYQTVTLTSTGTPTQGFQQDLFALNDEVGSNASCNFGVNTTGPELTDFQFQCGTIVINGVYNDGVALTNSNYIRVQVNVNHVGPFNIFTNSVNGYSFSAVGTFVSTGTTYVDLVGSGTPVVGNQTDNFVIDSDYGINECNFSINVN